MYLHIRETPDGGSIVATLRESYREDGKVRKHQHHLGSCPTDLKGQVYGSHVGKFWRSFDRACERLSVSPKDKREYARRVRAAGVPNRPRGGSANPSPAELRRLEQIISKGGE